MNEKIMVVDDHDDIREVIHVLLTNEGYQIIEAKNGKEALELLDDSIDEILRIHPPLISNRRVTTKEVSLGGETIGANQRLTIFWASANRDEAVFGDPDEFCPERNGEHNLLYGAGIHYCPGAPLARLVLRLVIGALLRDTQGFLLSPNHEAVHAKYPAGGFDLLPITLVAGSCCGGCSG